MKRILLLVFVVLSINSFAQRKTSKAEIRAGAKYNFELGRYTRAIPYLKQLVDIYPKKTEYKNQLGICYNEVGGKGHEAIPLLESVLTNAPKTKFIHYNLALAYLSNNQFDDAIQEFKTARPAVDKDTQKRIDDFIQNCNNGKQLVKIPADVKIENLGASINSKYEEYVPVISSDESVLIFTYRGVESLGGLLNEDLEPSNDGEYYEDIHISYKKGEQWTKPVSISENINTKGNDASVALSPDGRQLFIFKNEKGNSERNGQIYSSQQVGNEWSFPKPLGENVNSKHWEGSISMSHDNNTVYFSSERPGGLGGKDIYLSKRKIDGSWGEAVNLGPKINTSKDDDAPFIHPDNKTLYFSSMGHNSMGGYDIFLTNKDRNGNWEQPINAGFPINTTSDDIYYVVSANGKRGYFSSNRKGSLGGEDIYTVTPGIIGQATPVSLVLMKGITMIEGVPSKSLIEIIDANTSELITTTSSNETTGKYLLNIEVGKTYKILFKSEGCIKHTEMVNAIAIDSYKEINKNIDLRKEPLVDDVLANRIIIINHEGNVIDSVVVDENRDFEFRESDEEYKDDFKILLDDKFRDKLIELSFIDKNGAVVKNTNSEDHKDLFVYKDLQANKTAKKALSEEDLSDFNIKAIIGTDEVVQLVGHISHDMVKTNIQKEKKDKPENIYEASLKKYGDMKKEALTYQVQIAAYKNANNFSVPISLGDKVRKVLKNDGITRFRVINIATLNEAETIRGICTEQGIPNAYVIGLYKQQEYDVEKLFQNNFFESE